MSDPLFFVVAMGAVCTVISTGVAHAYGTVATKAKLAARLAAVRRAWAPPRTRIEPSDDTVVLEGSLLLPAADKPIVTFVPRGATDVPAEVLSARTISAREVRLRLSEDETIAIDGPVQVVLGWEESTQSSDFSRVARELDVAVPSAMPSTRGIVRVLHSGDRVRARGVLGRRGGAKRAGGADANEDSKEEAGEDALVLRPVADDDWATHPVALASVERPIAIDRARGPMVVAFCVGMAIAGGLGAFIVHVTNEHERSMAALLAEATTRCRRDVDLALAHGDAEAARGAMKTFTDSHPADGHGETADQRARTAVLLGDFVEASLAFEAARKDPDAAPPALLEIETHAAAKRYDLAAKAARDLLASQKGGLPKEHARLACAADAWASIAKDEIAWQRLRGATDGAGDDLCLLAGAAVRDRRADLVLAGRLSKLRYTIAPSNTSLYLSLLREPIPGVDRAIIDDLGSILVAPHDARAWIRTAPVGLEETVAARFELSNIDDARMAATYRARRANYFAFLGARAEATKELEALRVHWLERAFDVPADYEHPAQVDGLILRAAIIAAMQNGDFDLAKKWIATHPTLPAQPGVNGFDAPVGSDIELLETSGSARFDKLGAFDSQSDNELWEIARRGDGDALAARLAADRIDRRHLLLRMIPHITSGRDALIDWEQHGYLAPCFTCGIADLVTYLGNRRRIARALGDAVNDEKLGTATMRASQALESEDALFFVLENQKSN